MATTTRVLDQKRVKRTTAIKGKPVSVRIWKPKLVKSSRGGTMLGLRRKLKMTRETFSRLADTSVRTLANVEAGHLPSKQVCRKIIEVKRIIDALGEIVVADAIGPWLETPNEALGGAKPLEIIERGEGDRIWQMIYTLRSGGVS